MNKNILLIDDDQSISEVIKIFFEEEGYKVRSYEDGSNMELKIKEVKPDIILLDYMLPGKNGIQIVKSLRKKQFLKELPIIMIAANHIFKSEAKAAGINEFIEKPFDLYELLNTVNRYTKMAN